MFYVLCYVNFVLQCKKIYYYILVIYANRIILKNKFVWNCNILEEECIYSFRSV
jgi:hypothetical protein